MKVKRLLEGGHKINQSQLLTLKEITQLLGITQRQALYWIKQGAIKPVRVVPGPTKTRNTYYFDFDNLLNYRIITDMLDAGIDFRKIRKISSFIRKIGYSEKLNEGILIISEKRAELVAIDQLGEERYYDAITGHGLLFSMAGSYREIKKLIEEEEEETLIIKA